MMISETAKIILLFPFLLLPCPVGVIHIPFSSSPRKEEKIFSAQKSHSVRAENGNPNRADNRLFLRRVTEYMEGFLAPGSERGWGRHMPFFYYSVSTHTVRLRLETPGVAPFNRKIWDTYFATLFGGWERGVQSFDLISRG